LHVCHRPLICSAALHTVHLFSILTVAAWRQNIDRTDKMLRMDSSKIIL
jgi:hypothetical protein